jgi:hypothetical protein
VLLSTKRHIADPVAGRARLERTVGGMVDVGGHDRAVKPQLAALRHLQLARQLGNMLKQAVQRGGSEPNPSGYPRSGCAQTGSSVHRGLATYGTSEITQAICSPMVPQVGFCKAI